jgi:hypothetical protein
MPVASKMAVVGTGTDRRQVVFGATLTDGRGVLLVATPKPQARP